mmetsp:Transcript_4854/g.8834  ORF Transcript_4854/g.8834 Transcript_4854/m.8834 type:complete len:202 (+) Transcript_4854:544-1149(+)
MTLHIHAPVCLALPLVISSFLGGLLLFISSRLHHALLSEFAQFALLCQNLDKIVDKGDVVVSPTIVLHRPLAPLFLQFFDSALQLHQCTLVDSCRLQLCVLPHQPRQRVFAQRQQIEPDFALSVRCNPLLDGSVGNLDPIVLVSAHLDGPLLEAVQFVDHSVFRNVADEVEHIVICSGCLVLKGEGLVPGKGVVALPDSVK